MENRKRIGDPLPADVMEIVREELGAAFPGLDETERIAIVRVLAAAFDVVGPQRTDEERYRRVEGILRSGAELLGAFRAAQRHGAPS
ncbi:MAG: hypothetical protein ACLQVI_19735 [Polyangiaceae bacterium]